MFVPKLRYELSFPDPRDATPGGIVAYGGDLSPARLLLAYRNGIFPWYSKDDPIIWWSPDPRLIMPLKDFRLRKSLKKRLKHFDYRFDTAFEEVIRACAQVPRPGQDGSWIQEEVVQAYINLHHMGYAHSVESYQDGRLVGGLYGVVIGRVFCGESMFSLVSDASKAAFAVLVAHLKAWGFVFIDAQVTTEHLQSLGATEVGRDYFLELLEEYRDDVVTKPWQFDPYLLKKM